MKPFFRWTWYIVFLIALAWLLFQYVVAHGALD